MFSLVLSLVFLILVKLKGKNNEDIVAILLYTCIIPVTVHIIIAFIMKVYIFTVYKQQMKLREISHTRRENNDQFKLAVTTLLIATFILFSVLPNFLMFSHETRFS